MYKDVLGQVMDRAIMETECKDGVVVGNGVDMKVVG